MRAGRDRYDPQLPDARLLADAAEFCTRELARHPDLEADLRYLIGVGYNRLGAPERAEENLRLSLERRRAARPGPDPATAATLHSLGRALFWNEAYDESRAVLEEAIAMWQAVHGFVGVELAESIDSLGATLRSSARSRRPAAPPGGAGDAARLEAAWCPDIEKPLLAARDNVAVMEMDVGRFTEAEPLFREVIDGAIALGIGDQQIASTQRNLAACLIWLGRYEDALACSPTRVRGPARSRGAGTPTRCAICISRLGAGTRRATRCVPAPAATRLWRSCSRDRASRRRVFCSRGSCWRPARRTRPRPPSKRCAVCGSRCSGSRRPSPVRTRGSPKQTPCSRSCGCGRSGSTRPARFACAALAAQPAALADHPATARIQAQLGAVLLAMGRPDAAEGWFVKALETYSLGLPEDHREVREARARLDACRAARQQEEVP